MGAVIVIGRFSSKCSGCGRGADPGQTHHWTIVEHGPDTGKAGCGELFVGRQLTYIDPPEAPSGRP